MNQHYIEYEQERTAEVNSILNSQNWLDTQATLKLIFVQPFLQFLMNTSLWKQDPLLAVDSK